MALITVGFFCLVIFFDIIELFWTGNNNALLEITFFFLNLFNINSFKIAKLKYNVDKMLYKIYYIIAILFKYLLFF